MANRHRYVLVSLRPGVTLSEEQGAAVRLAVESLNISFPSDTSEAFGEARLSHDGRSAIYELTYPESVTVDTAFSEVASRLDIPESTLRAMVDLEIFDETGSYEGSLQLCLDFLSRHPDEWELQGDEE